MRSRGPRRRLRAENELKAPRRLTCPTAKAWHVTRDPVPVGDRLEILRTHPKLLLNGLVAENPHYLAPDDHIAAPPGLQRTMAWPRRRRPPDRRADRDELTSAELAAQASLAQPTLGTGTSTGSTGIWGR